MAVFGANGQIGSWLVDLLRGEPGAMVAVHRGSLTPRNSRYPVAHRVADMEDPASLRRAVADCDLVVNLAVDKAQRAGRSDLVRTNAESTENLLRECEAAKVRRFIHVSSIAVLPPRVTDQVVSRPFEYSKESDVYTRSKIATERVVREHTGNLEICILRPGIVYGPYLSWSSTILGRSSDSTVHLASDIPSVCHAVHALDVARLMVHLGTLPTPLPPLLYAVNPEVVSWRTFYADHARCADLAFHEEMHAYEELRRRAAADHSAFYASILESPPFRNGIEAAMTRDLLRKFLKETKRTVLGIGQPHADAESSGAPKGWWPARAELELYASTARFSPDMNGESLGFTYRTQLAEGCRETGAWWNFAVAGMSEQETRTLRGLLGLQIGM